MPKRKDIKSILVIGAGPIIIGQACEFDYSGTQACKALRSDGYRIILINSNPATIMTDPDVADKTYIEPITTEIIEEIIKKEKPDAILPTMGGQTALNAAMALKKEGILKKYNIELIGANSEAIENAEDREKFKKNMTDIGLECAKSMICRSIEDAKKSLKLIGLPAIIRPSFTLGGSGGGIAYTEEEYLKIIANGLDLSPTKEVLIEESLLGWKEFEILNDKAKTIDIETVQSFVNGTTFFLRKKNNSKPTNILLDGNRKLSIEIDPLSHIESQVALKYMLVNMNNYR